MAMAALMFGPLTANAQYREDRFGLQEWYQTSLLGKQGGGNRRIMLDPTYGGYNIGTQHFGDDVNGGFNIGTQQFGQEAPLGGGWLVLTMAGAAYAFKKRKNNNDK